MEGIDPTTSNQTKARALYVPQLRIATGLVLFAFATTHFLNHALGLISIEAMQTAQDIRTSVTQSGLGTFVLVSAAAIHLVMGFAKFVKIRTWRLGIRDFAQLCFGLLIPVFLIRHVLGTRGVQEMFGVQADYAYAMWAMWPGEAVAQAILITLVWVHGCIGMHHWLNHRLWYHRFSWIWNGLVVAIPMLAYAGYVAAGRVDDLQSSYSNPLTAEQYATFNSTLQVLKTSYYAILLATLAMVILFILVQRRSKRIAVTYANGATVMAAKGLSVLEISRANRIPHASVCGGRARCSTCRVRVVEGQVNLPPPTEIETQVLKRVAAPDNVRLACQLCPTESLTISTLLPGNLEVTQKEALDQYHWGVEQVATILFCDLRGFTKMSEGKLSYDVVFLLNQFLSPMAEAIQDSGGFVDKFMGDGIMAIFGMGTSEKEGAISAIRAARAMGGVLEGLNQSLREELPEPLQVGIGLNTGPVVLGRIGARHKTDAATRVTALGETVNTASRLEGLTKQMGVQVVVANSTMKASSLSLSESMEQFDADVRGLRQAVSVYAVKRAKELPVNTKIEPEPSATPK